MQEVRGTVMNVTPGTWRSHTKIGAMAEVWKREGGNRTNIGVAL